MCPKEKVPKPETLPSLLRLNWQAPLFIDLTQLTVVTDEERKEEIAAAERRGRRIAPGSETEERRGAQGADLGLCQRKKPG